MEAKRAQRTVLWQKCRRDEIRQAAAAGGTVLLPLGAVEQHGPHLPLDTDSFTAFTIATRAAERVREFPVLVLPPVWWGLSPYWMVFPGTLTLRAETLTELLVDIAGSVAHHGFGSMAIVNGHGGNGGLIQAAAVKASRDGFRVAALSYWSLIADELRRLSTRDAGGIGHAGEMETSIQLYLQPECVALDAVSPEQCLELTKRQAALEDAVYLPPDPRRESPHGVYGMSHAGTREKGEQVVEAASRALAALLQRLRADQA
jgi:creatinine amidohydrolase